MTANEMNSKEKKEIDSQEDLDNNFLSIIEDVISTQCRFVDTLEKIYKILVALTFFQTILIWRVFLWDPFSSFLDYLINGWNGLSEGYKILVLGIIGAIFSGIIAQIVGSLLLDKIKSKFYKQDN